MKKSRVVLVLLSMVLLLAFLGCDGNQAVTTDLLQASPYKKVVLSDLKPFTSALTEDEDITDWPLEGLTWERYLVEGGLSLIQDTIGQIAGESSSFTPIPSRSISAGLYLQIKDEGFRLGFNEN